jgi:hypothetical protein
MDHTDPPAPAEHSVATAPAPAAFTETEAAAFQDQDRRAAAHIVLLTIGIFIAGLILYSIVALVVAS